MVHTTLGIDTESGEGPTASPSKPSTFSLGGFGPTLLAQGMGALLGEDATRHFDLDDLAISRLHARGLLTYSQHVTARKKLAAKIRAAVDVGDAKLSSTKED